MSQSPVAPTWPRYLVLCLALAVCGVSQWYIFQEVEWRYSSWGLGLGSLLAAWALGAPQPLDSLALLPPNPEGGRRWVGVLLAVLGFAGALGGCLILAFYWNMAFGLGWALLLAGVALWSYGLARVDGPLRKAGTTIPWQHWELAAFLAILAIGFFLRFYRYDYFPPPDGVCAVEEPQSGQGANMILGGMRPWEFMLDRWMPVLGFVTIGHTLTAIRIPFTIVSWITIAPLYLLTRELMSRQAALFATLLFAICRWHIIYSRHAHAVFGPTLPLILLALYLCVRAYRRGGLSLYPWIGVLSSYTLYTYAGYRATTLFVGFFFFVSFVQHVWVMIRTDDAAVKAAVARSLKAQVGGAVLVGVAYVLLVVPLVSQLSWNPWYFLEAADRATNDDIYYTTDTQLYWQQRIDRIRLATMMFNHFGDGSPTFNMPGTPQLDPLSGALFVLGLAYCIVWGFYRYQGFFAFYFLFLFAFGTVFVHNYDVRRLQGIIPLIFVMIGYAVDRFGQVTLARLGRGARALLVALAVVISALALKDNYRVYFQEMMNDHAVRSSFHNTYTVGITYLHQLPDNGYMLLISDMNNFFTPSDFEWVRGDRVPGKTTTDLLPLFLGERSAWTGRELHMLIQEPFFEADELVELIGQRFPTAKCAKYEHPDQPPYADFVACRVPSEADGHGFQGGVRATYYRGNAKEPFLERTDPVISFAFTPHACRLPAADLKPPCRVVWEGTWEVTEPGDYVVTADVRKGLIQAKVDDNILMMPSRDNPETDKTAQSTMYLSAGPHRVRLEVTYGGIEVIGTRLRMQKTGSGHWSYVPFAKF